MPYEISGWAALDLENLALNVRGDIPAARRNVRTKFERSEKPTSYAIFVTGSLVVVSARAALRRRARTKY